MTSTDMMQRIRSYWNDQLNNEIYLQGRTDIERGSREYFDLICQARYGYIYYFTDVMRYFGVPERGGEELLEVGCGMGTDLVRFARMGYQATGIDLADEHIALAKKCFAVYDVSGSLSTGNAEHLDFAPDRFARVYSYGVLHHTPDTAQAIAEIHRVLRPGGRAFLMLYHKHSLNNLVHALLSAPFENPKHSTKVASDAPVTRRFSKNDVRRMCRMFSEVTIKTEYVYGAGYGIVYKLTPTPLYRLLSRTVGWHLAIYLKK